MIDSDLLKITYTKSCVGYSQRQKETIRSLGLRRLGESVMLPDSPPVRGMIDKVSHLVVVEPVGEVDVQRASDVGSNQGKSKTKNKSKGTSKTASANKPDSGQSEPEGGAGAVASGDEE